METMAAEWQGGRQEGTGVTVEDAWRLNHQMTTFDSSTDLGKCILLFGFFCNGRLEGVAQPRSMEHLLDSVAPNQCFFYAHPEGERSSQGHLVGEVFGLDKSKMLSLSVNDAWKVNKFKALVIGGGGILSGIHEPLSQKKFVKALRLPIIIMGVGTNHHAGDYSALLRKAAFVSGRDWNTVTRLAGVLRRRRHTVMRPEDVHLVRDPVLSDARLTDTEGRCWKQSKGENQQPLCFVVPAERTRSALEMHRQLIQHVVEPGDRFINVFPKNQDIIQQLGYPRTLEMMVDPIEFTEKLCPCKAIISTSFHGVVLGFHMGVPTFGAFDVSDDSKIPDIMIDLMSLPDQFLLINKDLTREVLDYRVASVRRWYEAGRRDAIHARLVQFYEEFQAHAHQVLNYVVNKDESHRHQRRQSFRGGSGQQKRGGGAAKVAAIDEISAAPTKRDKLVNMPFLSTCAMGSTAVGDCAVAMLLLFATVALALLSPRRTGNDGLQQGSPKAAASGKIQEANANTMEDTSAHYPHALQEAGVCNSRSAEMDQSKDPRYSDQGESGELPAITPPVALLHNSPRQTLSKDDRATIAHRIHNRKDVFFVLHFTLWIALAMAHSTYSYAYLRISHDPVGLLILQGTTGVVVLFSLGRLGLGKLEAKTLAGQQGLVPQTAPASGWGTFAAILHAGQALLTNTSLLGGWIVVNNVLKAMEPVVSTIFSRMVLRQSASSSSAVSFTMILAGVLLLTSEHAGEGGESENWEGDNSILMPAVLTMGAVCCNALRNVSIKKSKAVSPRPMLLEFSQVSGETGISLMLMKFLIISPGGLPQGQLKGSDAIHADQHCSWLRMDGVIAALCFVAYNLATMNLLARFSPVDLAVGNSVKPVFILGSSKFFIGEVLTGRELTGTAVALLGVIMYNVARTR